MTLSTRGRGACSSSPRLTSELFPVNRENPGAVVTVARGGTG
jgi:hypothetical protein